MLCYCLRLYWLFQSTLPRGERRICLLSAVHTTDFNPRSHEGSDVYDIMESVADAGISIHAPTRGATILLVLSNLLSSISIHAPTRGATCIGMDLWHVFHISIHAPTRGATLLPHDNVFVGGNFNPRSHEGSDPGMPILSAFSSDFNPRSHEGSDGMWMDGRQCILVISIHAPTRGATKVR
mgnify:CR=1 FL=1